MLVLVFGGLDGGVNTIYSTMDQNENPSLRSSLLFSYVGKHFQLIGLVMKGSVGVILVNPPIVRGFSCLALPTLKVL